MIPSWSRCTKKAKCPFACLTRMVFMRSQRMKDLLLRLRVVIRTSNAKISRRLADYVKKLHQKACRTCSTNQNQPIKSLICGVLVVVAVVISYTPYCNSMNHVSSRRKILISSIHRDSLTTAFCNAFSRSSSFFTNRVCVSRCAFKEVTWSANTSISSRICFWIWLPLMRYITETRKHNWSEHVKSRTGNGEIAKEKWFILKRANIFALSRHREF